MLRLSRELITSPSGSPIFLVTANEKREKMTKIATKIPMGDAIYQNIPNGLEINQNFPSQGL
jgi:hypothetical protein